MKIIQIDQNTSEWESFRRTMIGGSDAASVCGVDPYKKPEKLFKQKYAGEKQWVSPAMQRGKDLEPIARERYERLIERKLLPTVGIHNEIDWMMASFDGYDPSTGKIIEIKCPSDKTFDKIVLEGNIPIQYIYQMQHQMMVADANESTLVVFNGSFLVDFSISRDDSICKEILEKESHFYECLIYGEYK